jgi:hypothetical protein
MRENMETNEQVNRDAASVVPTPTTEDGGSGSTDCSFSATDLFVPFLYEGYGHATSDIVNALLRSGWKIDRIEPYHPDGEITRFEDRKAIDGFYLSKIMEP